VHAGTALLGKSADKAPGEERTGVVGTAVEDAAQDPRHEEEVPAHMGHHEVHVVPEEEIAVINTP